MIQYSEPDRVERPMTDLDVVDRIGADLRAAGYTADGVPELLGAGAHRALSRGELWPALRVTRDGSPLSTLVRLFLLGTTEPESLVRRALPTTGITAASGVGALERDGSDVRAGLDIRPHADEDDDYLVVSDLDSDTRPGPVRHDHVLGIGQASLTLVRAVIREPVGRVLDIGTGCGIQALHAFSHSKSIVATDTNPRALSLAGATARLNGQRWDLRAGSLFEPVAGEQFDLIISNPPFVIGTGTQQYIYRDSGIAGDGLCESLVRNMPAQLAPGGTGQLLANWIVRSDADWRERVGRWVEATGCDAWVVQRELADPAEYIALWLKDAGESGEQAAATAQTWLDYFAAEHITGIGMGSITLRRSESANPDVVLDEIAGAGEDVSGPETAAFLARRAWLRDRLDTELLASHLALAPSVILDQRALAGPQGWTTALSLLRRLGGPRDPTTGRVGAGAAGRVHRGSSARGAARSAGRRSRPRPGRAGRCRAADGQGRHHQGAVAPGGSNRRIDPVERSMGSTQRPQDARGTRPASATPETCEQDTGPPEQGAAAGANILVMRAVAARVTSASVTVAGEVIAAITVPGLLVLVGVTHDDTPAIAAQLARKLYGLRILREEQSCESAGAPLLIVSQFTLYGQTVRGRRPSWGNAAPGPVAEPLIDALVGELRSAGATVGTGAFGAEMAIASVNDGPFTVLIELPN